MRHSTQIRAGTRASVVISLFVLVGACGRSENVGWADREMPERVGAAGQAVPPAEQPAMDSLEVWRREYQALAQQLNPLQQAAMADSALAAGWQALSADLETSLRESSDFYRGLLERRDEIEARLALARQGDVPLSMEEQAELGRFYRNVQTELARARTNQVRGPEFSERFAAFRSSLFEKMRAIEPDRIRQVNRLERLHRILIQIETEAPAGPGAPPDANARGPG